MLLRSQGYEVRCAEDGFDGLAALKQSLPDIIISDLRMPNMNGFEFLSVVRRRFPLIPVLVISGEFTGVSVPESVLADAFFPKGGYRTEELFAKIGDLLRELPPRSRSALPGNAAVWIQNGKERVAITCPECLHTFPLLNPVTRISTAECDFCSSEVHFEPLKDAFIHKPLPAATVEG